MKSGRGREKEAEVNKTSMSCVKGRKERQVGANEEGATGKSWVAQTSTKGASNTERSLTSLNST